MSNEFKPHVLKQRREHLQLSRLDVVKRKSVAADDTPCAGAGYLFVHTKLL